MQHGAGMNWYGDLDKCIREWLQARELFLSGTGRSALDGYDQATQRLYVAFAEGWSETEVETIGNAFHAFRKLLMQEADGGDYRRRKHYPGPVTATA